MKAWGYKGKLRIAGFTKLHDNADGSATYQLHTYFVPRWHHVVGVPIALWLALR